MVSLKFDFRPDVLNLDPTNAEKKVPDPSPSRPGNPTFTLPVHFYLRSGQGFPFFGKKVGEGVLKKREKLTPSANKSGRPGFFLMRKYVFVGRSSCKCWCTLIIKPFFCDIRFSGKNGKSWPNKIRNVRLKCMLNAGTLTPMSRRDLRTSGDGWFGKDSLMIH